MASILVIDDEAAIRTFMRMVLEKNGHRVIEAGDGDEGIRVLQTLDIDLLVTDLLMPGKEGIETIRDARKLRPDVKIIAISGGSQKFGADFLPAASELGADRTLSKPFRAKEFIAAVHDLLAP